MTATKKQKKEKGKGSTPQVKKHIAIRQKRINTAGTKKKKEAPVQLKNDATEVEIVFISGISFPHMSRKYLMDLVGDVVREHKSPFIVIAGHTVAGQYLEEELSYQIAEEKKFVKTFNQTAERGEKIKFAEEDRARLENTFIEEKAEGLNRFLPELEIDGRKVNYHITIAEKIYDRPIGVAILKRLKEMRADIRLFNDTEAKIPVNLFGIGEMRVLIPRRHPWFYKNITGLMQRLVEAFVSRTFSPKPPFIVVGCTGTGVVSPYYKGIPVFTVPTLHKIDEQKSTENMVGCLVLKLKVENGSLHISPRTYDFRTAVFNEREYLIEQETSDDARTVLETLKPSSASKKTIVFRLGHNEEDQSRHQFTDEELETILGQLVRRKIVVFDKDSNRYGINEDLVAKQKISLDEFLKGSTVVKHEVGSCFHIGALKTLYTTLTENLWRRLIDKDAFILNGDTIQGIAHNYEYNGDLRPDMYGYDKQNIAAAHLFHALMWKAFVGRYGLLMENSAIKKLAPVEIVTRCIVPLVLNLGNHDLWDNYAKRAIPLHEFEFLFKTLLFKSIVAFAERSKWSISSAECDRILNEKFIRVGENCVAEVNGIYIGVKHTHKARTQSKSQRSQEAVAWFEEQKQSFIPEIAENHSNLPVVYVANFHEASASHISTWGRTIFSVMTGAFLKDTQFEKFKDKVVDYGTASVHICLNAKKKILFTEVEFDNEMHPVDEQFVMKDHLTTGDVFARVAELSKHTVDMPWR